MQFKEIGIDETTLQLVVKVLVSTALGLIIGLERERRAKLEAFIGIRTVPLITVLGTLSAFIFENYWKGIFIFTFGALILFTVINYYKEFEKDVGITTEVTLIISFIIGTLVYFDFLYLAVFLAFLTTTLLALKPTLERFAKSLDLEDIISILKFILIVAVIYPILPDKNFGPFDAFNLKSIWKVVVIVSFLDFIGYVLLKWKGSKTLWLTGVIGGLVSSTAVSYELAKKTKQYPSLVSSASLGIAFAWTIMNIRVIVLAGVISLELAKSIFLPLFVSSVIFVLLILYKYKDMFFSKREEEADIKINNPFDIWSAIQFGIIYSLIKFSIEVLDHYLGSKGVYLASFISGIIDVDAITLSLANMVKEDLSALSIATVGILIAVISNSLFKYFYIFLFGTKELMLNIMWFLVSIVVICTAYILLFLT